MFTDPTLTAERLREVLDYDPATGVFRWKVRPSSQVSVGQVAGNPTRGRGYRQIGIDGANYRAHRLAWLHVHGVWPIGDLDHRNGVRDDNRLANLREASRGENLQNQQCPSRQNNSGFLGVCLHRPTGKWQARITVNRKGRYLGLFNTPEEASEAYQAAKRELHPFWDVA